MQEKSRPSTKVESKTVTVSEPKVAETTQPQRNIGAILRQAKTDPHQLSSQEVLHLQQTVGNQTVRRLLGKGIVANKPLQIQRLRASVEVKNDLVTRVMKLLKSFNLTLALQAVEVRTKNGDFDAEDLDYVLTKFNEGEPTTALQTFVDGGSTKDKPKRKQDYVEFVDTTFPNAIENLKAKVVDAPVPDPEKARTADTDFTVLKEGDGKNKIQVPTSHAGGCVVLPLSDIRWSQSDVKKETGDPGEESVSLDTIVSHMSKGGWRGKPAEVVNFVGSYTVSDIEIIPAGYVSKDNRRLLCAFTAGLSEIPCVVKNLDDGVPSFIDDKLKKNLWYDKTNNCFRTGNSGEGFNKKGQATDPTRWVQVMQSGKKATNYRELVLIRTANQPAVMATGEPFTIGGSSMPPYMKI